MEVNPLTFIIDGYFIRIKERGADNALEIMPARTLPVGREIHDCQFNTLPGYVFMQRHFADRLDFVTGRVKPDTGRQFFLNRGVGSTEIQNHRHGDGIVKSNFDKNQVPGYGEGDGRISGAIQEGRLPLV